MKKILGLDHASLAADFPSLVYVSHKLADSYALTELARSLAYWAAWAVSEGDEEAPVAAAAESGRPWLDLALQPVRAGASPQGRFADELEARRTINEFDAKRLLATYGIPMPREQRVMTATEATAAAPVPRRFPTPPTSAEATVGVATARAESRSDEASAPKTPSGAKHIT